MSHRNIVVLGGSAGAGEAVLTLLKELPRDWAATIFIALHLSPASQEWLSGHFCRATGLQVESPEGERPIHEGHIYVARPDRHLVVKEGRVIASRGPRENMWRPAVDVLFRTAAVAYGNRVIGVLMSGQLDDGTSVTPTTSIRSWRAPMRKSIGRCGRPSGYSNNASTYRA